MKTDLEIAPCAHFINSLEAVTQALKSAKDSHQAIDNILEAVSSIFNCDRIWLFHPCDPDASTFRVLAEKNKPEYPGAFTSGQDLPVTAEAAQVIKHALTQNKPVAFDTNSESKIDDVGAQFSVKSQLIMAVHPRSSEPWMFGMHQCSYARIWTQYEHGLFKEISSRVVESLNNLILFRKLKKSEKKYRRFFETVRNGWAYQRIVVDKNNIPVDYIFLEINKAFEIETGLEREQVIGKKVTEVLPGIEKDPANWIGRFGRVALTGESVTFEKYSEPLDKWYTVTGSSPEPGYFITVFEDISERKKIENEKEKLVVDLRKALDEIETLRGILPLCSFCKKIRDDKDRWEQVDVYLHKHSQADISHCICPECIEKHYPDLHKSILSGTTKK